MYFKLNQKCAKVLEGKPLQIYGLRVSRLPENSTVVELGLAFLYDPEKKLFGIYQRALLQGKKETIDTLIAHSGINEEVEFILESNKATRRVTGLLRFKSGTERRFAIGMALTANVTTKLTGIPPEQHQNGAKALVYRGIRGKFLIMHDGTIGAGIPTLPAQPDIAKKETA